jgi:hypothetical protein
MEKNLKILLEIQIKNYQKNIKNITLPYIY